MAAKESPESPRSSGASAGKGSCLGPYELGRVTYIEKEKGDSEGEKTEFREGGTPCTSVI